MDEDFYAQVIITTNEQAPLLADGRLARIAAAGLNDTIQAAPGRLWGYVILPDQIRLVVGPADDAALEVYIEHVKADTEARLLEVIRHADDETLDRVLRYNPVWGGAIYQVWQAGSHRQIFWSEYKLSNALYEMLQCPVEAGLVAHAEEWPYRWVEG
jgi:hypothetical protein